jgi:glutaminyl-peptide cyclotransferase
LSLWVAGGMAHTRWGALVAVIAVSATGVLSGCGDSAPSSSADAGDRFDAEEAYELVERQVAVGQRPAGSPRLRKLAAELRPLLPDGRFEPIPGEPELRNVVGTLPGREPAIVVGAHYDTLVKPRGFVGANNGAAGTAVVIEVAQALRDTPAGGEARQVRFVLFDGEEPAVGRPEESPNFYAEGLRGSRAYVTAHPGETEAMILLDYVGNQGLQLPREANSTEALWNRVLLAADAVGAQRFFSSEIGPGIEDDHTPFLRGGVPAVDLIDWSYPGHSLSDGLDKISRESLDGVGETVVRLAEELRAE